jgi:hypothetical protein
MFLISNASQCDDRRARTILAGPDESWSDTLHVALAHIPHRYVLLWIDDHFLVRPVNTASILSTLEAFRQCGGNYIRLHPLPRPDTSFNEFFGSVSAGSVYRTATVASVWRKDVLAGLLRPGESAWEFEVKGSLRSDRIGGFFAVWRSPFAIENLMIKGKLRRGGLRRVIRTLGTPFSLSRPVLGLTGEAALCLAVLTNRLLIHLPGAAARALHSLRWRGARSRRSRARK